MQHRWRSLLVVVTLVLGSSTMTGCRTGAVAHTLSDAARPDPARRPASRPLTGLSAALPSDRWSPHIDIGDSARGLREHC